jgi:chemotaxis protein methyltransferase CheR
MGIPSDLSKNKVDVDSMSRMRWLNRTIFDLPPVRPIGRAIYASRRSLQTPAQSTATKFFRNLNQLKAFEAPLHALTSRSSLRVLIAGCSMGCEAFTLAAYLAERFPSLDWRIDASDISSEALQIARRGVYGPEHGLGVHSSDLASLLEGRLFNRVGDRWIVREEFGSRVVFAKGDVLDEQFRARTDYDVVFGQNFMIHMSADDEAKAFENLVAVTRPDGAVFVGGMDLDRRQTLVREHRLTPVDWNVVEIHDGDEMRRSAWPWHYWSLEPINTSENPFLERYATIFLKRVEMKQ